MKKALLLIIINLSFHTMIGQIIPPGLGEVSLSSWIAIGLNQEMDTLKNRGWKSSSYIGHGRINDPEKHNLFQKSGIFILNQEFYNRFHQNWEYSLALSYRKQDIYKKEPPFDHADPSHKNEFRLYSRFSYLWKTDFVEISPTFRQEIMNYYNSDFSNYKEDWRLRSRFRLKFAFPLSSSHKILVYSEQLFSTQRNHETKKWSSFKYNDSRFSVYYSHSPSTLPLTFNIGYMLNLVGTKSNYTGHYLAMDIIFKDIF